MGSQTGFDAVIAALNGITSASGPLANLFAAICYVMALLLAVTSLFQLKHASEERNVSTYRASLLTFIAAAVFAATPEAIATVTSMFYNGLVSSQGPLGYVVPTGVSPFRTIVQVVNIFGYFFFARGIYEIKRAGEPQRYQNASVYRAVAILGAGMAAIYIDVSIKIMAELFQWDTTGYLN